MHRRFKNWLETNPHADSHISAVEKALSADWMGRLSILFRTMAHGNNVERECAERGMRRLLLGEEAVKIDTDTRPGILIKETFARALELCMKEPVLGELDLCMHIIGEGSRKYGWNVEKRDDGDNESEELLQGKELMETWRAAYVRSEPEDMMWYKKARYTWTNKFGGWQRSYQHHTITRGTAVSIVVQPGGDNRPVITECADLDMGKVEFYAVYGILFSSECGAWCVVKRLVEQGDGYTVQGSRVSILQLGNRVRRVALFHKCNSSCVVHAGRLKVRHSETVLKGGVYRIARRADGYPPHLG